MNIFLLGKYSKAVTLKSENCLARFSERTKVAVFKKRMSHLFQKKI